MTRSAYFKLCMSQSVRWLQRCAASPSQSMTARHIALVRLAIRRKT